MTDTQPEPCLDTLDDEIVDDMPRSPERLREAVESHFASMWLDSMVRGTCPFCLRALRCACGTVSWRSGSPWPCPRHAAPLAEQLLRAWLLAQPPIEDDPDAIPF